MRYQRNLFAERCRDDVQLLCGEQLTSHQLVGHSNARTGIDNPPDYCHPFLAGVSTAPGRCPVQAGKSVRLVAPVRIKIVHRGIRLVLKDPVRSSARCPADDKHAAAVNIDPDRISLIGGGFTGRADVLDGRIAACAADSPWPPPVIYALRRATNRLRTVNGPFGPHPARPIGPPGPCRQTLARLTLSLLLRHLGGKTR